MNKTIRGAYEKIKRRPLIFETISVIYGVHAYKQLEKKYGKETHIILLRGATGDNYIQFLLLNEYIRQHNIKNYILVTHSNAVKALQNIFYISDVIYIETLKSACMQKAFLFLNGKNFNMSLPFYWDYFFGFTYNRCRVRMLEQFNFMDTYVYFSYNMDYPISFRKPQFEKINHNKIFVWENRGIVKNKTVLISPEANSVTQLPVWFWNCIIKELQQKGFHCVVNCNHPTLYCCENFFPSYTESVPVLEFTGYFLGIRSGFCDIISTAKCKKIIIYPKVQDKINYSEHRSEIEFSGFVEMGFVEKKDSNCIELSTSLIRNITDEENIMEGTDDYFEAVKLLREEILSQF